MAIQTLVVDDDEAMRLLMRYLLEDTEGYAYAGAARDGLEAIELVASIRPDLVLLDLMMPRMDGFQALPRIRRASPGSRVVILSMMPREDAEADALRLGADLYLDKAMSADEIVASLNALMAQNPAAAARTNG